MREPPSDPIAISLRCQAFIRVTANDLRDKVSSHHPRHNGPEHTVGRSGVEHRGRITDHEVTRACSWYHHPPTYVGPAHPAPLAQRIAAQLFRWQEMLVSTPWVAKREPRPGVSAGTYAGRPGPSVRVCYEGRSLVPLGAHTIHVSVAGDETRRVALDGQGEPPGKPVPITGGIHDKGGTQPRNHCPVGSCTLRRRHHARNSTRPYA
jgi:hypothetical protein